MPTVVKEHPTGKPTSTERPTRTPASSEQNTRKPTFTERATRTPISSEQATRKPTSTERATRTPQPTVLKEHPTGKPTNTEKPTRTPIPPKPPAEVETGQVTVACSAINKGNQANGEIHVTLTVDNESGATITRVSPGHLSLSSPIQIRIVPSDQSALPTGHRASFLWQLSGSGSVSGTTILSFTDGNGQEQHLPVSCD
jgi:hypothetical protein